ncbi:hypothetical protein [Streptomyces caniferus]|uniref:hypothetical protein n=1 Tax=Streptomyces caniferus TaxID=285557 RepID=UPI0038216420
MLDLGNVQRVSPQTCLSYRSLKGFAWAVVHKGALVVTLPLNPATVDLRPGFTRDLRGLGHHGSGDREVQFRTSGGVERAQELFRVRYAAS